MRPDLDFEQAGDGAAWLSNACRRSFLMDFEQRLLTEVKVGEGTRSYREILFEQALLLRELITNRARAYRGFRLHA